jgi:5-methylcytosine-specific restriction endonuclease McrA
MNSVYFKKPRERLRNREYEELRRNVIDRDGWRCQNCGARENLVVHHMRFRSHSGDDSEENLITLCNRCHGFAHHI